MDRPADATPQPARPTDDELLTAIQRWQSNRWVHPLTCGTDSSHHELDAALCHGRVVLTCRDCDWEQDGRQFEWMVPAPLASSPSAEPTEPTLPDTGPLFTDEQVEALKRAAFAAHSASDHGDVFRAFCACGHSSFGSPQPLCSLLRCVRIARSKIGEAPLASAPSEALIERVERRRKRHSAWLPLLGTLRFVERFAYEHGLHEMGWPLAETIDAHVAELRAALSTAESLLHSERLARETAEQRLAEATARERELRLAGKMLSNCAFNLVQGGHLTETARTSLRDTYRGWDATVERHIQAAHPETRHE